MAGEYNMYLRIPEPHLQKIYDTGSRSDTIGRCDYQKYIRASARWS